tara:strand:+ start:305 stop:550 length:246 start_codon:yes stop_codon:yes gene_type:complete
MEFDGTGEYIRSIRSMMKAVVLEIHGFREFFVTSESRQEVYDKEVLNELMGIRNELKSVRMELSLISEVIVDVTKEDNNIN